MTFVNPAILWGLFAVSIPIIIHIFNLKKTRKIEFSTLMFLKEIQETKLKRIRLKQLLILFCRIAFIILLVMAFAGPFSKGFLGSIYDRSPASVLILLDDSFSMNGRTASGTDFESAKKSITELLNTLETSDEIYFVPVSRLDDAAYSRPHKGKDSIIDSLSKTKISDIRKTFPEILYGSKKILSYAKFPLKEIYFVTDGQSSLFTESRFAGENILDEHTRLSIALSSNRTPNNISIDSIDIRTKIFAPGRTVKFSVLVNNHNNFNITNKSVVFTSGSYRDEKAVDVPADSKTTVDFSLPVTVTGFISGRVELTPGVITEDEIPNDNSRFVVFYIPDELRVLLISPQESDAEYVKLALQSSEALTTDSSGKKINFYKIKWSPDLLKETLNNYNSVVLTNKIDLAPEEAGRLKEYLEDGGGAIIYFGRDANIARYNETLFSSLSLPFLPAHTDAAAVFEKVDLEHPIFEGVFKSKGKDIKLDSPSITSFTSPQTGNNSQSLIKLNNGQNFLVQYSIGRGKLLAYAIAPDYSCSNFPESAIFPPLTVRSVAFVSKLPEPYEAIAGKDFYFNPDDFSTGVDSLQISTDIPGAPKIHFPAVAGTILNLKSFLASSNTYTISSKLGKVFQFPVNTDPAEALTQSLNAKDISVALDETYKVRAEILDNSKPIQVSIRESRSGKVFWQFFLAAAIMFLAVEYFIAKSIPKTKK